jgi:protein-S-isoprenylcysteine O-methyltransferase Ste14
MPNVIVLPPKGLLIALAAQLPLALARLPLRPARWEIATGLVLVIAGVAINVWAECHFRRAGVGACPFSPAPLVVESGPYRFTRNPMYVGLIALCLSVALLCGAPLNAWTAAAYAIWLHRRYVLPEEQFLMRERGEEYAAYARRVPRWITRWRPPPRAPRPPRARR